MSHSAEPLVPCISTKDRKDFGVDELSGSYYKTCVPQSDARGATSSPVSRPHEGEEQCAFPVEGNEEFVNEVDTVGLIIITAAALRMQLYRVRGRIRRQTLIWNFCGRIRVGGLQ